jgi:cytoskeletal protein CcmA (bactofilin family)
MKYLYVLLVIIVIYYIISSLSENYSSSEHFDPSLVPVSSIVTLAKVAQKLIDGGGTLTNPGNLRIGMPSAPGNFGVTGNTELGLPGTYTIINGITDINSDTSINSNLSVSGGIYIKEGNLALNNGTINMISDGTGGLSLIQADQTTGTRLTTGNTTVNGNLSVKKDAEIGSNLYVNDNIRANLLYQDKRLHIKSNTEDVYIAGKNGVTIAKNESWDSSGNLNVDGNITINGTLDLNNIARIKGNVGIGGELFVTNKLCIDGACLSKNTINLLLPAIIPVFPNNDYDNNGRIAWAKSVVDDVYPVLLWDGWLGSGTGYLCQIGFNKANVNNWLNNFSKINTRNFINWNTPLPQDAMNFVIVAPGYGVELWNGWNGTNDGNANGNKGYIVENTGKEAVVRHLKKSETGDVYEFNTDNDKLSDASWNVWDHMTSFSTYKLPPQPPK